VALALAGVGLSVNNGVALEAFMEHLAASLDAVKVQSKEKAEALELVTKLRPEIGIRVK
jgi:hypothetical protein